MKRENKAKNKFQVIEHDENLSDKEIFPSTVPGHRTAQGGIPSIGMYVDNQQLQNTRSNLRTVPEITKEVSSDVNLSEDDYLDGRRGTRMQQGQQHYQVNR